MFHLQRAARGANALSVNALGALAVSAALIAGLAACTPVDTKRVAPAAAPEQVLIYPDVTVAADVPYGPGVAQRLDVCQPADAETSALNNGPRRAVISVHGGSWREGDKADPYWRSVCEWLASEGFIAFSVNYSLAPAAPFPAGIADVRAVVDWLRQPAQVAAYEYDPALIGAFGGSAGGNLVALLGAEGTGPWDVGSRVAAVVELSGPIDLTGEMAAGYDPAFRQIQLDYLGCASYLDCPLALQASPSFSVDPSDPPFFVAHSEREFIPIAQAEALVSALEVSGVDTSYVAVPGKLHSLAMLDDGLREQIIDFLRARL